MSSPQDRFGTGLARPFRYAPGGFVSATGVEKVLMCVEELLAIPIGSLPWRCGVGTRLLRLRHMNNSQDLRQIARVDSSDALQQWEPRFRLSRVTVAPVIPGAENQINLTVSGTVVGVKEVQTAKANI